MYYVNEVVDQMKQSEQIVIYGARIVANEVVNCLMGEPYHLTVKAFLVSEKQGNPNSIMGIPVMTVKEGKERYKNALVLVAVLEKYYNEIMETLQKEGFKNIISLTFESDLWSGIRGNYYKELCREKGKEYLTLEEELEKVPESSETGKVSVYMAKCHVDRELKEDISLYGWETPIQVGADLTEIEISRIKDNIGENISRKNREYCELTALYWIWKNDKISTYAGLCHYRRHFCLDKLQLARLANSDIDVVLTIPILNYPNVRSAYIYDHCEEDWEIMLEAIKKLAPEYYKTADRLQKGVFYYAYNMFIAKKEIFDLYCSWLFPILDYCETYCAKKEDIYQNRFIGFLAERLMSIFFLQNDGIYKIVHAKKHFLAV